LKGHRIGGIACFSTLALFALLIPGSTLAGTQTAAAIVSEVPQESASRGLVETYEVQNGDSLSGIADLLSVDVETLQALNDIPDPNAIKAGQVLVVPDVPTRPVRFGAPIAKPRPSGMPELVWPAIGPITTRFGVPGSDWIGGYHMGLDIGAPAGAPIIAASDGLVEWAGLDTVHGYGNYVLLFHHDGYETLYAHMSRIEAQAGQSVHQGDLIGYVGATGFTTGPHLHFELRLNGTKIDPEPWLP
jgi:murein DD-endopeptidase MepM/ murein hydrolase activator NlpD